MEYFVAVENPKLRARLVRILRSLQLEPAAVGDSSEAYRVNPLQLNQGLILLETGDNIHCLTQIVNDLHYSPWYEGGSLPVICFVSRRAFDQNPTLGFWLIAGSAAVTSVQTTDFSDAELTGFFSYLEAPHPKEQPKPSAQPEFADTVAAISTAPAVADG